jgi:hypothetical protein
MNLVGATKVSDLRGLVLWWKKSYGTHSARKECCVERMTTVAETVRRAGQNILNFITKTVLATESMPFLFYSFSLMY